MTYTSIDDHDTDIRMIDDNTNNGIASVGGYHSVLEVDRSNSGISNSSNKYYHYDSQLSEQLEQQQQPSQQQQQNNKQQRNLFINNCCNNNNNRKEIIIAILFLLSWRIGKVLGLFQMIFNKRLIPYQLLNNGEYVRNLTNNEIFIKETIPDILLLLISFIIPLLFQCILVFYSYLNNNNNNNNTARNNKIQTTICTYCIALGLTGLVTECIKNYVGYLRPIFYDLCQPNDDYSACTNTGSDFRKSFPSGHASVSFCGLSLLTFYINQHYGLPSITILKSIPMMPSTTTTSTLIVPAGNGIDEAGGNGMLSNDGQQIDEDDNNHEQIITTKCYQVIKTYQVKKNYSIFYYRIISILSLIPICIALFIATSRVHDNKHFPADIIAGAIIGYSIATFIYGLWW